MNPEISLFQDLGLALRILRELKGIKQAELAKRTGMGKSQISKYENGKELPKFESLEKVLRFLEYSPLSLFYVNDFFGRMREGAAPDLRFWEASLSPVFSNTEGERVMRLICDLLELYQATGETKLMRKAIGTQG